MEDKNSIKEFVAQNIEYFIFLKNEDQLFALRNKTYQKLQVTNDNETEVIVFTDGRNWYKTPYSRETYTKLILINSKINYEIDVKRFISENISKFNLSMNGYTLVKGKQITFEDLQVAKEGNQDMIVYRSENKWWKIKFEPTLFEGMKAVNEYRKKEMEMAYFVKHNIWKFNYLQDYFEVQQLGEMIFQELRIANESGTNMLVFTDGTKWYKTPYSKNIQYSLMLRNKKSEEANTFVKENLATIPLISTQEQLNAVGVTAYYKYLQVASDGKDEFVVFSVMENFYKIKYDRTQEIDVFEAFKQANQNYLQRTQPPKKSYEQNGEAR